MRRELPRFEVAYYSGTGSTAMAAGRFYETLTQAGCSGGIHDISREARSLGRHDVLLLIFPLHACNAPEAVYRWIESIHAVNKIPAVVISVSGGGEISPNTAGRMSSIKKLEKKGYDVIYDGMLVMPSNWIVGTKEPLAVKLLEVLPDKVERIVDDIVSGVRHRTKPLLIDRFFSKLGELEKPYAKSFGKTIETSEECDSCGWCSQRCPARNISIVTGKPKFEDKCHMCLSCIYGCHKKALTPRSGKFIVVKEGYNLEKIEKMVPLTKPINIDELAKGYFWSGVKKYLQE